MPSGMPSAGLFVQRQPPLNAVLRLDLVNAVEHPILFRRERHRPTHVAHAFRNSERDLIDPASFRVGESDRFADQRVWHIDSKRGVDHSIQTGFQFRDGIDWLQHTVASQLVDRARHWCRDVID